MRAFETPSETGRDGGAGAATRQAVGVRLSGWVDSRVAGPGRREERIAVIMRMLLL